MSGSKKYIAVFVLLGFVAIAGDWSEIYNKDIRKSAEAHFPEEASILQYEDVPNTGEFYWITQDTDTIGCIILAKAYGKYDFFDFMVCYDEKGIIKEVKVLQYREDFGFEISSKRWLRQFIGLGTKEEIEFRGDVQAISGATLSSRSITDKVNQVTKELHKRL